MSGITTDTSHWPLVLVTFPNRELEDREVEAFIADQRAMLGRRERHALVADATAARVLPARQRQMMSAWLSEAAELNARYTATMAIVIDSSIIRGALTAVMWVSKPKTPTVTVATVSEGAMHCLRVLEDEGVPGLDAARAWARSRMDISA